MLNGKSVDNFPAFFITLIRLLYATSVIGSQSLLFDDDGGGQVAGTVQRTAVGDHFVVVYHIGGSAAVQIAAVHCTVFLHDLDDIQEAGAQGVGLTTVDDQDQHGADQADYR